jgi:hypothetical protein
MVVIHAVLREQLPSALACLVLAFVNPNRYAWFGKFHEREQESDSRRMRVLKLSIPPYAPNTDHDFDRFQPPENKVWGDEIVRVHHPPVSISLPARAPPPASIGLIAMDFGAQDREFELPADWKVLDLRIAGSFLHALLADAELLYWIVLDKQGHAKTIGFLNDGRRCAILLSAQHLHSYRFGQGPRGIWHRPSKKWLDVRAHSPPVVCDNGSLAIAEKRQLHLCQGEVLTPHFKVQMNQTIEHLESVDARILVETSEMSYVLNGQDQEAHYFRHQTCGASCLLPENQVAYFAPTNTLTIAVAQAVSGPTFVVDGRHMHPMRTIHQLPWVFIPRGIQPVLGALLIRSSVGWNMLDRTLSPLCSGLGRDVVAR